MSVTVSLTLSDEEAAQLSKLLPGDPGRVLAVANQEAEMIKSEARREAEDIKAAAVGGR